MRYTFVLLLASPCISFAQPAPTKPPPDHGMVLAAALEVAPGGLKDTTRRADTKNYVYRGRVITLNKERTVHLCFDTELMRVAGAWVGKPLAYTVDKNMGPVIDGKMLFTTKPGPGWAKDGKWDDPRVGGEGPLPHDWAHYRGLYVHGDKVVLSYTIGDCSVLEMPEFCAGQAGPRVSRTLTLGKCRHSMSMLICDEPNADWLVANMTKQWPIPAATVVSRNSAPVAVRVEDAPQDAQLKAVGGRLTLELPALPSETTVRVVIVRPVFDKSQRGFNTFPKPKSLQTLTKGGPIRWHDVLDTRTTLPGPGPFPYVVDDIPLPLDNPWHMPVRPSGLDFFADGRAAVCTWDGDVWIVSGLDGKLDKVRWKRFAAGLQQPLGLKIIDGVIHTAGRDQITRLHDLNGDGEADFYENLNNDAGLTLQRHEFVMDLQTDRAGNLYFGRSGHYVASKRGENCCVFRLSPDGKKLEKFAAGFREPNGLSIGPDGTMIVSDNEGNGVPQTPLYRLQQGGFYGYQPSKSEELATKGARWTYERKPLVWLPINVDRSAGSQVWATDPRFGPLAGQLLHTSYGHAALYGVLIDRKAEPWQGAVWKLPLGFSSGIMRGRVNPADGQVYLCGLRGWSTNAVKDGQLCRVRYTGKALPLPVGFEVTAAGLNVTFSGPLDKATAEDEDNWAGDWADPVGKNGPTKAKKEELPIRGVKLSADRNTVTVEVERLRPMANFRLQYRIKAADGAAVAGELHGTIHRVPGAASR